MILYQDNAVSFSILPKITQLKILFQSKMQLFPNRHLDHIVEMFLTMPTQELKPYLAALPQHAKILLGLSCVTSHLRSVITDQIFTRVTTCH